MKKMKKAALIFGTGLCLAVGTGGTLAYLGDTGQVANKLTFAGEKGLDAVLTEPLWNPQKGLLTVPGSSVAKDPQITNTSELNMNELAALKCEFVYSQNCPDKSKRGKVLSVQDMEKVVRFIPLIITVTMLLKENGCDLLIRKRQTLYSIFTTRKF